MDAALPDLDRRLTEAVSGTPSRIPVLVGPCGSGRTTVLRRVAASLGPRAAQYVDLERVTSTPERFLAAILRDSPFQREPGPAPVGPGEAHARALRYVGAARADAGTPATWLLDEILEIGTFAHFPGLRRAVAETVAVLAASDNRFILASKFTTRTLRTLRGASDRFLIVQAPALSVGSVAADLLRAGLRSNGAEDAARVIVQLAGGRPAYCAALVGAISDPAIRVHDPIAALAALMAAGGGLNARCRYSYEFRLHRARGYGALKAALDILAREEPLTLTEIAQEMERTPGSTKDYLGWLEDVDLVRVQRKRYTISDPLLRVWIRLYSGCDRPSDERIAEEVQRYSVARLSASPD